MADNDRKRPADAVDPTDDASPEKKQKVVLADIAKEYVCPITFVRVRLQIEKMGDEESLEIRLRGLDPLKNIPESVLELGHTIVSLDAEEPKSDEGADTVHRLLIKKKASTR